MRVRSMDLNDELGRIGYVFSDKTGTLTLNYMQVRICAFLAPPPPSAVAVRVATAPADEFPVLLRAAPPAANSSRKC